MQKDTIGLRVPPEQATAKCISIIRKYDPSSIGTIKARITNKDYVIAYPYTDRMGLKTVLSCYEDLVAAGITPTLYELDDAPATLDFLKNLDNTCDEISAEIDAEDE